MKALPYLAAALFALVTLVHWTSLALAAWRLKPARDLLATRPDVPPVSLVCPLCGIEEFSEETFRSRFALTYPHYELIFCVADVADPIIPLARKYMAKHPERATRLITGDVAISINPKLNNCVRGWDEARYDWVVLVDSNVLTPPDYIQRLRAAWRPNTGLVCSTPAGSRPGDFWAEVECAFLNSLQARWQYAGEAVGLGFAQGKSMLWNKPFLDERGGIGALAAELAEDAAATKLVRKAGRRVHLVDAPFEQPLGRRTLREVVARQFRWARLRRLTFPFFFLPECMIGAVLPVAAGAFAAHALGWSVPLALLAGFALWYLPEMALSRRLGWHLSWRMPLAFLVRDLSYLPIWAYAWISREVVWRGNVMRLDADEPSVEKAVAPAQ